MIRMQAACGKPPSLAYADDSKEEAGAVERPLFASGGRYGVTYRRVRVPSRVPAARQASRWAA